MTRILLSILALGACGLSGCASFRGQATGAASGAPSASVTYDRAVNEARDWQKKDAGRRILQVSNTGSMEPFFGGNAIVGLESVHPQQLRPNDIISYRARTVEKIHQVVGFNRYGVVTRGQRSWTTDTVPYAAVTGRMATVFYFDRASTAMAGKSGHLPVGFASPGSGNPAPGISILRAQMLTTGPAASITRSADGYEMSLDRDAAVRLSVGPKTESWEQASMVDIRWTDTLAGAGKKFSIFDQANPEAGTILLHVNYSR